MATERKKTGAARKRSPRALVNVGRHTYTVVITPNDPDGYLVTCPALPGLVTQGDTFDEARAMAADAIACHLESIIEDGLPIPVDETIIMPVSVKVA
ncbi:MAG TPA: type II toxin-antitoxin system HicB family antitoxin [Pyrinomonadaceae bacterium]|jgi:predicted RNase H-like HicB family nuclease|nr:type II toxin-antitoxin system HicB family antitoxin [Pyrinomonadaceae bacterium]